MSEYKIFEQQRRFLGGHVSIKDYPRFRGPSISTTPEKKQEVLKLYTYIISVGAFALSYKCSPGTF